MSDNQTQTQTQTSTSTNKFGTITLTNGTVVEVVKILKFQKIKDREITYMLTSIDTIAVQIRNTSDPQNFNEQNIMITMDTFSLLVLSMLEADKQFDINSTSRLPEILGADEYGFLTYE